MTIGNNSICLEFYFQPGSDLLTSQGACVETFSQLQIAINKTAAIGRFYFGSLEGRLVSTNVTPLYMEDARKFIRFANWTNLQVKDFFTKYSIEGVAEDAQSILTQKIENECLSGDIFLSLKIQDLNELFPEISKAEKEAIIDLIERIKRLADSIQLLPNRTQNHDSGLLTESHKCTLSKTSTQLIVFQNNRPESAFKFNQHYISWLKERGIDFQTYYILNKICFSGKIFKDIQLKNIIHSFPPVLKQNVMKLLADASPSLNQEPGENDLEKTIEALAEFPYLRLTALMPIFNDMLFNLPRSDLNLLNQRLDFFDIKLNFSKLSAQIIQKINFIFNPFFKDLFLQSCSVDFHFDYNRSEQLINGSLEEKLKEFAFIDNFDIAQNSFADFLYPNEKHPERVATHLDRMSPGYMVSTGTERSFFNLIFASEEKCKGVIVVDINPLVKAYNDFNVMLIRLCDHKEDYKRLSANIKSEKQFVDRLLEIAELLKKSDMPQKLKNYYFKNLKASGGIFFREERYWRSRKFDRLFYSCPRIKYTENDFALCRYDLIEEQYSKIKRYADAGNIVSLVWDIDNLSSLPIHNITLVDISNIPDYIDIRLAGFSTDTLVVYTDIISKDFYPRYSSYFKINSSIKE